MASISVYTQDLHAFTAERATRLDQRLRAEVGTALEAVYGLVWPDYDPPSTPHPQQNRAVFRAWASATAVPLWGWFNARPDQTADAAALAALTTELDPAGWLLDIEGEWTKGTKLTDLVDGAVSTRRQLRASLAGATPAHVEYDYRTLDRHAVEVDWQAYFDSGEGCDPATAVRELHRTSFVIEGWEYRHHLKGTYGWGRAGAVAAGEMVLDSYLKPGPRNATFKVAPRAWGHTVVDGRLKQNGTFVGELMGRCKYPLARVSLDVTRGFDTKHTLAEWAQIAATARVPDAKKRGVSVYMGEATSDDVLVAIAKGAA